MIAVPKEGLDSLIPSLSLPNKSRNSESVEEIKKYGAKTGGLKQNDKTLG